jgi:hypothetical protein
MSKNMLRRGRAVMRIRAHVLVVLMLVVALAPAWVSAQGLMEEIKGGSLEGVKKLVAEGADVNAPSEEGFTPLITAIMYNRGDIASALIENGANVNGRGGGGITPLMAAAMQGNKDLAGLLLTSGADVNAVTPEGFTALKAASSKDMAAFLISVGASENPVEGRTDLSRAELQETLRKVWDDTIAALQKGDTEKVLSYFSDRSRERYREAFLTMSRADMESLFLGVGNIEVGAQYKPGDVYVECTSVRAEGRSEYTYPMRFVRTPEGKWKISSF